jgi:hypothetical protein
MFISDTAADRQPGVIDSIADGLTLALARPLLLFLPMALDLYFWAGWQVWLHALTSPVRDWVLTRDQAESADIASSLESLGRSDATQLVALFTPSLLAGSNRSDIYSLSERSVVAPDKGAVALLALLGFALLATLVVMIYSVPLADAAVKRNRSLSATMTAICRGWIRSLGLHMVMIGIGLILIGPVIVGAAALLIVGVDIQVLVGFAIAAIGLGGFLVWWFAMKAIVVSEAGPLRALYYGFAVVRRYFWQCLGFTAAWLIITFGLGEIWLNIADTAPGLLIAVIANAFFAGGMAMAGMLFYEGRIRALAPVLSR